MCSKLTLKRQNGKWYNINMNTIENTDFCVVQFLHKPHSDIPRYVIIPDSWIKPRGVRISVLYPEMEHQQKLEDFYHKNPKATPSDLKWTEYLSELKYTARDYDDALGYITMKKDKDRRLGRCSVSDAEDTSNQNYRKRRRDERNSDDVTSEAAGTHNLFYKTAILMENMAEILLNYSKEVKTTTISRRVDTEKADDVSCYMSAEADSAKEQATTPTVANASFELPPEYDPQNPRWSLRYPHKKPGLEKLVSGYEVYVSSDKIKEIRDHSRNVSELTNSLLPEIFIESALRTCTLIGDRTPRGSNAIKRPGLNKDGRNALTKFVRSWAGKQKWYVSDDDAFKNYVSKKLYTIRKKTNNNDTPIVGN